MAKYCVPPAPRVKARRRAADTLKRRPKLRRTERLVVAPRKGRARRGHSNLRIDAEAPGAVLDSLAPAALGAALPAFEARLGRGVEREALEAAWLFAFRRAASRGAEFHRALVFVLRALPRHPLCGRSRPEWSRIAAALEAWLYREPIPDRASLARAAAAGGEAGRALGTALALELEYDLRLRGLPRPRVFPGAREKLAALRANGRLGIGVAPLMLEAGRGAATVEGRLPARQLIIGTSRACFETSRALGAAFLPILPGRESESWEAVDPAAIGAWAEGGETPGRGLVAAWLEACPRLPPWLAPGRSSRGD